MVLLTLSFSNSMRQQAMQSRMLYGRPIPVSRLVQTIADSEQQASPPSLTPLTPIAEAQNNTQIYGRRPYGVGFLVIGEDETGPHLLEFSPSGTAFEYYAHSIGARSQSAKTYLEKNYESFETADLPALVNHGLSALADTLQQDKHLTTLNTSIAIIGPSAAEVDVHPTGAARRGFFRIIENEEIDPLLRTWRRSRGEPEDGPQDETEAAAGAAAPAEGEATEGEQPAPGGEDVEMA